MRYSGIKAIILAGGLGTRLKSAIGNIPKSMALIHGKPFLEYEIEHLKSKGIKEIVLCVSHLRKHIIDYFGDGSNFGVSLQYSIEEKRLGTGGAIKHAVKTVGMPDYFIVLNGDTFIEWDLESMLKVFFEKESALTMVVVEAYYPSASFIEMGDSAKIIYYREKPSNTLIEKERKAYSGAGIYLIKRRLVEKWSEGALSLERDCIPKIVAKGKVYGVKAKSRLFDIGTPYRIKRFSGFIRKGNVCNGQRICKGSI